MLIARPSYPSVLNLVILSFLIRQAGSCCPTNLISGEPIFSETDSEINNDSWQPGVYPSNIQSKILLSCIIFYLTFPEPDSSGTRRTNQSSCLKAPHFINVLLRSVVIFDFRDFNKTMLIRACFFCLVLPSWKVLL